MECGRQGKVPGVWGEEPGHEAVHALQGRLLLLARVPGQALADAQVPVRAQPAGDDPGPPGRLQHGAGHPSTAPRTPPPLPAARPPPARRLPPADRSTGPGEPGSSRADVRTRRLQDSALSPATASQSEPAPLRSGCRIKPDGGYESYADGMLCDDRGFPMARAAPKEDVKGKQVRPCISCGGQGRTSTTCEGIVRSDYCATCEGQGVVFA